MVTQWTQNHPEMCGQWWINMFAVVNQITQIKLFCCFVVNVNIRWLIMSENKYLFAREVNGTRLYSPEKRWLTPFSFQITDINFWLLNPIINDLDEGRWREFWSTFVNLGKHSYKCNSCIAHTCFFLIILFLYFSIIFHYIHNTHNCIILLITIKCGDLCLPLFCIVLLRWWV